jgi:hypothetical protein
MVIVEDSKEFSGFLDRLPEFNSFLALIEGAILLLVDIALTFFGNYLAIIPSVYCIGVRGIEDIIPEFLGFFGIGVWVAVMDVADGDK